MDNLNKYIYIENLLSKEEIDLLWNYAQLIHRNNVRWFDEKQTKLGETYQYGSPTTDGLLLIKQKIIEEKLNKKLLPTYTFWRLYTMYSNLASHTDREECEYTVSITVAQDKTWPLFVDGKEIIIKPGDGILYQGAKYKHWREEYDGDYAFQIFLHYVEKDGKYKDLIYDQRKGLGVEKI